MEKLTCVVCWEEKNNSNIATMLCTHVLCTSCYTRIRDTGLGCCPCCRLDFADKLKQIYVSPLRMLIAWGTFYYSDIYYRDIDREQEEFQRLREEELERLRSEEFQRLAQEKQNIINNMNQKILAQRALYKQMVENEEDKHEIEIQYQKLKNLEQKKKNIEKKEIKTSDMIKKEKKDRKKSIKNYPKKFPEKIGQKRGRVRGT